MTDGFVDPTEAMTEAMSLRGDIDALARYYADWANTYDADVSSHGYALPSMMVTTLHAVADLGPSTAHLRDRDLTILDAGCGTGLVGVELTAAGYEVVDGIDLSPEMVDIARTRGIYRRLEAGVDLTVAPPDHLVALADVVLVAGVFTVGHVPPEALVPIAALAKPNGVLITSTRRAYYETTAYGQVSDRLVGSGAFELLLRIDDAPYSMDSTAHYWAYRLG